MWSLDLRSLGCLIQRLVWFDIIHSPTITEVTIKVVTDHIKICIKVIVDR